MQWWIDAKQTTMHQSLRWMVSCPIRLFLFLLISALTIVMSIQSLQKSVSWPRKCIQNHGWFSSKSEPRERLNYWVNSNAFELKGMPTFVHLNLLPLGVYNVLLRMDWLYKHHTKVDYFGKEIEFLNKQGGKRVLQGRRRLIIVRQAKQNRRNGCVLFVV